MLPATCPVLDCAHTTLATNNTSTERCRLGAKRKINTPCRVPNRFEKKYSHMLPAASAASFSRQRFTDLPSVDVLPACRKCGSLLLRGQPLFGNLPAVLRNQISRRLNSMQQTLLGFIGR